MKFGEMIHNFRIESGLTQEQLAYKIMSTKEQVSSWELDRSVPEKKDILLLCKILSINPEELMRRTYCNQRLALSSFCLIARDFNSSVRFYEKLLGQRIAYNKTMTNTVDFHFGNSCIRLVREENLTGHHYEDGDNKFVLNFVVGDIESEYARICELQIGDMTGIRRSCEGYLYFKLKDCDDNVIMISEQSV